ncbi:MAG: aspartate--ammonia ligase [Elusimicrobiaceae bacterium]|nr:aspartate--ammonia ligase [Elusimicrobiaceae bacterium]
MSKLIFPVGYQSTTDLRQTQKAIKLIKDTFQSKLAAALNLQRVSAPLFVEKSSGLNDDLNGVERPVSFDIKQTGVDAVIVHSLAKWKRMALKWYHFAPGTGLYTDMNAIRRDEETDNLHSIYVDQWDWEKIITPEERNTKFLQEIVCKIVGVLTDTLAELKKNYPQIKTRITPQVHFISTLELEEKYPDLTPKQREKAITQEYGTVFVSQIGAPLKNGLPHDGRAPDYDDWQLNGDLLVYNEVLQDAFEISSMGIRVNARSLKTQLEAAHCLDRLKYPYHQKIASDQLPLTIGGGIGQSRLCMLMLGKAHIGEVQSSLWPQNMREDCAAHGINLL